MPSGRAWWITLTAGYAAANSSAIRPVPSLLPSLTISNSPATANFSNAASTFRTAPSRFCSSFRAGITTETIKSLTASPAPQPRSRPHRDNRPVPAHDWPESDSRRGAQRIEGALRNHRGHLGRNPAALPAGVGHQQAAGFPDGSRDQLLVQRADRTQVDHLGRYSGPC